jgi:hypothetical protein
MRYAISLRSIRLSIVALLAAVSSSTFAAGSAPQPSICNRSCWGAQAPTGSIPQMGSLTRAIVHHSAGTEFNTTGLEDSKADVRGIQNTHRNTLGWSDIGYHFLIDKYGNIFEGRSGSISTLPRGAHDLDNRNSFGTCCMGYFHPGVNNVPTAAMLDALYDVIAWRMPNGWTPYGSPGGSYGDLGNTVGRLDAHRRVKATACPGDGLFNPYIGSNLNAGTIRSEIQARINGISGAVPMPPTFALNADGRMEITGMNSGGAWSKNYQFAGAWNGWGPVGFTGKAGLVTYPNTDGRLEAFAIGTNDVIHHSWQIELNGGWSGWSSMNGTGKQLAVGRNSDGRLELFTIGMDNALWHAWQVSGGWSGWASLGGLHTQIAVASNAGGPLEVFAIGTGNVLYHNWQTPGVGSGWSGWAPLGGAHKQICVGTNADGRLEVFAIGTDNAMYHNWQVPVSGGWSGWASLGGNHKQIGVVSNLDGRLELFGIGTDDALYHNWQVPISGDWSGWASLGGIHKQFGMGRNSDGRVELFGIGTDNAIYHRYQTVAGGSWAPTWYTMGGNFASF